MNSEITPINYSEYDVRALVPHSKNMVLIDKVKSYDEDKKSITMQATLRPHRPYWTEKGEFQSHWLVEIMAQSVAAYHSIQKGAKKAKADIGYLISIDSFENHKKLNLKAFDNLTIETKMEIDMRPIGIFLCTVHFKNEHLASARMKFLTETDQSIFEEEVNH